MKIVVDISGGDYSPTETVLGAIQATQEADGFAVVLVGDKEQAKKIAGTVSYDAERVLFCDAKEVITNDDVPTEAIRKKTDSSLVKALAYLQDNEDAVGMVSSGSTGAVLTGSVLLLKRLRGINRPALCPVLPTVTDKSVLLMDCGANVEPKPVNLLQFAVMASAYASCVFGISRPKIALLSNGTEEKKGSALNKEVYPMLTERFGKDFIGNREGRDILSGEADVFICDGYSGNIALKSCEGTALGMFSMIKDGILKGGLRAKIGYLLLKSVFKSIKQRMDYNKNGGAVLLGLDKIVVKSHGSSKATAIKNSVLQVKTLYDKNVIGTIREQIDNA